MQQPPSNDPPPPQLELTPLIDVVFVVLVCFMLTAPLLELDQVALAASHASEKKSLTPHEVEKLQIHVHADDTIWIQRHMVADRDLGPALRRLRAQQGHGEVLVFHDRRAKFGTYEWLKGELSRAGFDQMDIVLGIPQETQQGMRETTGAPAPRI